MEVKKRIMTSLVCKNIIGRSGIPQDGTGRNESHASTTSCNQQPPPKNEDEIEERRGRSSQAMALSLFPMSSLSCTILMNHQNVCNEGEEKKIMHIPYFLEDKLIAIRKFLLRSMADKKRHEKDDSDGCCKFP